LEQWLLVVHAFMWWWQKKIKNENSDKKGVASTGRLVNVPNLVLETPYVICISDELLGVSQVFYEHVH